MMQTLYLYFIIIIFVVCIDIFKLVFEHLNILKIINGKKLHKKIEKKVKFTAGEF